MNKKTMALLACAVSACSSLPQLEYPDGSNRIPVNSERTPPGAAKAASAEAAGRIKLNQPWSGQAAVEKNAPALAAVALAREASEKVEYVYEAESDTPVAIKVAGKVIPATASDVQNEHGVAPAEQPVTLKMNTELASIKYAVFFNYGSRVLTSTGEEAIQALAQDAKHSERIEIIGRADNIGQAKLNSTLAKARAESVRVALRAHGVQVKNIILRSEVADMDLSQDAQFKGVVPTNVAERSRRADVQMSMRVLKGQKEMAENTKKPVDPAIVVALK